MTIVGLGWPEASAELARNDLGKRPWVGGRWAIAGWVAMVLLIAILCAMAAHSSVVQGLA
jgi:hypothetical protein